MHKKLALIGAIMGLSATAAGAQDKVKVGVIATLSGPPAVLGQQLRNGFQLAVKILAVSSVVAKWRLSSKTTSLARRRGQQGEGIGRSHEGGFRRRPDFFQHADRDNEAGDRRGCHSDQPECGHLQLRRQRVQS